MKLFYDNEISISLISIEKFSMILQSYNFVVARVINLDIAHPQANIDLKAFLTNLNQ